MLNLDSLHTDFPKLISIWDIQKLDKIIKLRRDMKIENKTCSTYQEKIIYEGTDVKLHNTNSSTSEEFMKEEIRNKTIRFIKEINDKKLIAKA